MEPSLFARWHVQVIGFRGSVPYGLGLFRPVYLCRIRSFERYAFGDEILTRVTQPMRSASDIRRFAEAGVITRLQDAPLVKTRSAVVCVTEKAEMELSDAIPKWRDGKMRLRIVPWRCSTRARKWVSDDPASAAVLSRPDAVEWLKATAILIWAKIDEILLANTGDSDAAEKAESLGWIAWEALPAMKPGMRRETMIRIVAARKLQPQRTDFESLVAVAATSLHISLVTVSHLMRVYLLTGCVPLPAG